MRCQITGYEEFDPRDEYEPEPDMEVAYALADVGAWDCDAVSATPAHEMTPAELLFSGKWEAA